MGLANIRYEMAIAMLRASSATNLRKEIRSFVQYAAAKDPDLLKEMESAADEVLCEIFAARLETKT